MADLSSLLIEARGPRTVTSVAAAANVSRRTINVIERGPVPTLSSLIQILNALGVGASARRAMLDAHMAATAAKAVRS